MRIARPPRNQRLINAHYGRDWLSLFKEWLKEGQTQEQIAARFSSEVPDVSITASTISRWIAAVEEQQEAA
jgi:hypothetical protein